MALGVRHDEATKWVLSGVLLLWAMSAKEPAVGLLAIALATLDIQVRMKKQKAIALFLLRHNAHLHTLKLVCHTSSAHSPASLLKHLMGVDAVYGIVHICIVVHSHAYMQRYEISFMHTHAHTKKHTHRQPRSLTQNIHIMS